MKKSVWLYVFWLVFLITGPGVVLSNVDLNIVGSNKILLTNFFQRILGMAAFGLITFQVTLGGNMDLARKYFGSLSLKFHKLNGLVAYTFIFLHPVSWIIMNYFSKGVINPFYPFIDVCGICKGYGEYFYNFGRLAFWSITFAVLAAKLVSIIENKWLRRNWRKIHILNYFAFYFVSVHAFFVGSDNFNFKFLIPFVTFQLLVLITVIKKMKVLVRSRK